MAVEATSGSWKQIGDTTVACKKWEHFFLAKTKRGSWKQQIGDTTVACKIWEHFFLAKTECLKTECLKKRVFENWVFEKTSVWWKNECSKKWVFEKRSVWKNEYGPHFTQKVQRAAKTMTETC